MNYKIFRAINRLAGRNSTLDTCMIFISQKTRFLYIFLIALMWFRDNSYKKNYFICWCISWVLIMYKPFHPAVLF